MAKRRRLRQQRRTCACHCCNSYAGRLTRKSWPASLSHFPMAAAIRVARAPKFRIERADDDARMIRTQTVKANEMPTVHGKHATSFYDRKFKDAFIRPAFDPLCPFRELSARHRRGSAALLQQPEAESSRSNTVVPRITPLRSRESSRQFRPGAAARRPMRWPESSARSVGYARSSSASPTPNRRPCSRTQTGIRVRTIHGSPPQTPGTLSIPGKASPKVASDPLQDLGFFERRHGSRKFVLLR